MRFQTCGVVKGEIAGEGKDAAGGGGDQGLDEEDFLVVAQVEVDTGDFLRHLQRAHGAAVYTPVGGHCERGLWQNQNVV